MNPTDLKRVEKWPCKDILFCVAAADDATRCWIGSSDSGVYGFDPSVDPPERKRLAGDGHSSYVTGMTRCGGQLITAGYDRRLIWWDLDRGEMIRSVDAHEKWIRRVVATPDGRRVITVADDMRCRVWNVESGEQVADFSDHSAQTPHHYPSMLYALAVSHDGRRIATGDRVGHVAVWDADSFRKVTEVEVPVMYTWDPKRRRHSIGGIRSLAFSPDGRRLAVGGMGEVGNIDHLQGKSRVEIFELATGERLHTIEDGKKKGLVEGISWATGGQWLVAVGGDHKGFVTIYDAESGEMLQQADAGGHVHAIWHDASFRNILLAAHNSLSRWTMAPTA